jgi:hypothetical protein
MGTATTLAVLTRIWGLHIGGGENCEPTSASRIDAHTTERSDDVFAVARPGLMQVPLLEWGMSRPQAAIAPCPNITQKSTRC